MGTVGISKQVVQELGFSKAPEHLRNTQHSAVLRRSLQTTTRTGTVVVLCKVFLYFMRKRPKYSGRTMLLMHHSVPYRCTTLLGAGGKVFSRCWCRRLWMCLLYFRRRISHWLPVALLEVLLIYLGVSDNPPLIAFFCVLRGLLLLPLLQNGDLYYRKSWRCQRKPKRSGSAFCPHR